MISRILDRIVSSLLVLCLRLTALIAALTIIMLFGAGGFTLYMTNLYPKIQTVILQSEIERWEFEKEKKREIICVNPSQEQDLP